MRPLLGLIPTTLLNEAGERSEPPMSEPSPDAWMPAASTAPTPPEDPDADFVGS